MSYSCSVKTISRSSGRSATAAAAYRNAELIIDTRTGERHDYSRRSGVESVLWFAPVGCAQQTSADLWNRVEAAEKRKNSTVAREVLVALPHELNPAQRRQLVERMTAQLAERYGVAGTAAIHSPDREGDQRNWHAHILMTTRKLDPATGELGAKTRVLDDKKTGSGEVVWIRQMVEREGNAALESAGHAARLDSRSLKDQGIDRDPTIHEGPRVTAIRRECERAQRQPLGECDVIVLNDAIRAEKRAKVGPQEVALLRIEVKRLDAEIIDLQARAVERINAMHLEAIAEDHQRESQKEAEARAQRYKAISAEIRELERTLFEPTPSYVSAAKSKKENALQAIKTAKTWHKEHPTLSKISRTLHLTPRVERVAVSLASAYNASEELRKQQQWLADRAKTEDRLKQVKQEQARLQVSIEAEQVAKLMAVARTQLEAAEAAVAARMKRWLPEDAFAALSKERDAHAAFRNEIGNTQLNSASAAAFADRAEIFLERMELWDDLENVRIDNAAFELEAALAKKTQLLSGAEKLRRGIELFESNQAERNDSAPEIKPRGPRMG